MNMIEKVYKLRKDIKFKKN